MRFPVGHYTSRLSSTVAMLLLVTGCAIPESMEQKIRGIEPAVQADQPPVPPPPAVEPEPVVPMPAAEIAAVDPGAAPDPPPAAEPADAPTAEPVVTPYPDQPVERVALDPVAEPATVDPPPTDVAPTTTGESAALPDAAKAQRPEVPAKAGDLAVPHIIDDDPIYDESNPSYDVLQRPSTALSHFPIDRRGRIDWIRAMGDGLVEPRADRDGVEKMEVLDLDVLMSDTRDMEQVMFPHDTHTEWLACSNCHPRPFVQKTGANPINMDAIFRGEYCGLCHDKVAFSVFICERCHNTPR